MRPFSERRELRTVRDTFQVDSVDIKLRIRLWNCLYRFYFRLLLYGMTISETLKPLTFALWDEYFGLGLDDLESLSGSRIFDRLKTYFLEETEWYEVYDFLEFIVFHYSESKANEYFKICCNKVLRDELSAYRFIGNRITQITSESEISEVEEALKNPIRAVKAHLERALELLSDKEHPDYRNSIKESISAVEALSKIITGEEKASLGQALKILEKKASLHKALKKAFESLYGYTSDKEGIRHALLEESTLSFEDAKFMLVACSAFVNYLTYKIGKK